MLDSERCYSVFAPHLPPPPLPLPSLTGTWGWDYDQVGVVCSVRLSHESTTAWQRFLPGGPLALLPLGKDLASIVWSTSPSHAAELVSMPDTQFVAALNAAFTAPAQDFQQRAVLAGDANGDLYNRPRDMLRLDPIAAAVDAGNALADVVAGALGSVAKTAGKQQPPGIIEAIGKCGCASSASAGWVSNRSRLFGCFLSIIYRSPVRPPTNTHMQTPLGYRDAAHSMHPLAGQGLNLGLSEVSTLVAALERGTSAGADPGSLSILRGYEQRRYGEAVATVLAMDAIKAAFSKSAWANPAHDVWVPVRNIGMAVLNRLGPVKGAMAKLAMGSRDWRS